MYIKLLGNTGNFFFFFFWFFRYTRQDRLSLNESDDSYNTIGKPI